MINNKFIYALTLEQFNQFKESIMNSQIDPIVFIQEGKKLWACNQMFDIGHPEVNWSVVQQQAVLTIGDLDDVQNQQQVVLSVSGDALSLRGTNNNIIISSNAITTINTDQNLTWSKNVLSHNNSGVTSGTYGETQELDKVNTFKIPYFTVDSKGHLKEAGHSIVTIRDYVVQEAPGNNDEFRHILTSGDTSEQQFAGTTKKGKDLKYNDKSGILQAPKIESHGIDVTDGDVRVVGGKFIGEFEGEVTGSATPKVHLSPNPEYGGASKNLYGHVKVQDELGGVAPPPSSSNESITSKDVEAIAASPLMVWNESKKLKVEIDKKIDKPTITTKGTIPYFGETKTESIEIGTEQQILKVVEGVPVWSDNKNISTIKGDIGEVNIISDHKLTIKGSNGVIVEATASEIKIKGIPVTVNNEQETGKENITEALKFGDDFKLNKEKEITLKWLEL